MAGFAQLWISRYLGINSTRTSGILFAPRRRLTKRPLVLVWRKKESYSKLTQS